MLNFVFTVWSRAFCNLNADSNTKWLEVCVLFPILTFDNTSFIFNQATWPIWRNERKSRAHVNNRLFRYTTASKLIKKYLKWSKNLAAITVRKLSTIYSSFKTKTFRNFIKVQVFQSCSTTICWEHYECVTPLYTLWVAKFRPHEEEWQSSFCGVAGGSGRAGGWL